MEACQAESCMVPSVLCFPARKMIRLHFCNQHIYSPCRVMCYQTVLDSMMAFVGRYLVAWHTSLGVRRVQRALRPSSVSLAIRAEVRSGRSNCSEKER